MPLDFLQYPSKSRPTQMSGTNVEVLTEMGRELYVSFPFALSSPRFDGTL